ncbi:hypothetical protein [Vibrio sonorensis]|uniref:hypothetical protein n=1 Tax=Vibrio sonorensis TaxID=1004316 RepID=UPI0008D9CF59|nr:hypothetical protein [Vibrio sonorensis]
MFCSETQLETLFKLYSQRELTEKMREAIRYHNNGGWSGASSAARAGVSENALRRAIGRLRAAHNTILQGYGNYTVRDS